MAQRVSTAQIRLMGMLGRPLPAQVAQLLLDEAIDARIELAQRTLAAMLGAQRPSINKILKEFERDRLITVGYAVIEITDQHGLRARAQ
ncbi:transcriptional regulator [Mycobacterium tuberculosis]|nr:transcriptional regulator [Mycobacterium tuberculosis]